MSVSNANITRPDAAMLVIGDEILSGRTQDINIKYIAKELVNVGILLEEVRVVPDKKNSIIVNLKIWEAIIY